MGAYNFLARRVLAPSYDVLRGTHTTRCLAELERSQWWPLERIEELQSERLRRLIEYVYRSVPHYRSLMLRLHLTPADIRTAADLQALPVLTRIEVQDSGESFLAEGYPRHLLRPTKTSGSTGTPLSFYGTREDHLERGFARGIRAFELTGLRLGDRVASIGRPRLYATSRERMLRRLSERVRRRMLVPVDSLNDAALPGIVHRLAGAHLDGMSGYPNGIALLACCILDTGVRAPAVRSIVTGGAELLAHERKLISDAFGIEPCSNYSSYEAFAIAAECQAHEGLHIAAEDLIVEILDDHGHPVPPGTPGRVVVTNLHNYGMPFIRYDLGDEAAPLAGTCSCGRALPRLDRLVGRKSRFLVTRSGRRVFAGTLYLDRLAGLGMRQYQLIQEDIDHVVMRLVPPPNAATSAGYAGFEARVRELFETSFGTELALRIEFVERILPTEAGKHVFMLSRVAGGGLARQSMEQPAGQGDRE